jgi:hypothetical protein
MPVLASLQKEFPELLVLALTVEERDNEARASAWMESAGGGGLRSGRAVEGEAQALFQAAGLNLKFVPANVLITAQGRLVRVMGAGSHREFQEAARAALR